MKVNEAIALAERLESLFRRSKNFNKDRETILEEIWDMADDLRKWADRIEEDMVKELCEEK